MSTPQQQLNPPYTLAEYRAFAAAHNNRHPADKTMLLGNFVADFPASVLVLYAYVDYYQLYFDQRDYPKTIEYVNKVLAFGDKVDVDLRLSAQGYRAMAYFKACGDRAFQTPQIYADEKDAAAEGLRTLAQWQKPGAMNDDDFATQERNMRTTFNFLAQDAEAGLKNDKIGACQTPPAFAPSGLAPDPGRFDRILNQLDK